MKNNDFHENKNQVVDLQQATENWIKPEITILSVKEETLGLGGGGSDFGSEIS